LKSQKQGVTTKVVSQKLRSVNFSGFRDKLQANLFVVIDLYASTGSAKAGLDENGRGIE
jgi:hypothetical protein